MKLAEVSVKRPVFAIMMTAALIVLGAVSYEELGLDLMPKTDAPVVSVQANLPGASAEEIETTITKRIEEAVNTISGIDELRASSDQGNSRVTITFTLEREIESATQDVRDKLAQIVNQFPRDTRPLQITKMDPDAQPIFGFAVYGPRAPKELTEIAVREAEARSGGEALPGAAEVAILFCDLKDFTAYAEREGEGAALEAIEALASIVTEECRNDGRIVKGLGDGYMLSFSDPHHAVDTGWRVIERRRESDGPGIHASLHQGVAIAHDGDYFGTVVNVAARILGAARRDELMATEVVAEATPEFDWQHAGGSYIRGVPETIDLYKLVGPRG